MFRSVAIAFAGLALVGATVAVDASPADPAAAIAMAQKARGGQAIGLFRMKVAAVGKSGKITYLNSKPDYRSEGNVTFSLSQSAARHRAAKAGVPDLDALVGRELVVAGRIEKRAIVNLGPDGRQTGFNRWAYQVEVRKPTQLVSVSPN